MFSNLSTMPYPECFFQSHSHPVSVYNNTSDAGEYSIEIGFPFQFSFNSANYSGISLFKIIYGNCLVNGNKFEEFTVLKTVSDIHISDIGSSLVLVCYCENGLPDCTKQILFIDFKTGEKLILDVAIADRGNHIVNGSIESEIRGSVLIRDDQKIQEVLLDCIALIFNIYSFEASQQLIMSP